MANTAWRDGHRVLCQWQKFDETWLSHTLSTTQNYCSSPNSFNAPWDCKPHFNSDVLADTAENERHVRWAVELCSLWPPERTCRNLAGLEMLIRSPEAGMPPLNPDPPAMRRSLLVLRDILCAERLAAVAPEVAGTHAAS